MLVVVHDGYVKTLFQLAFYLETLRSFYIFEVYASESGGYVDDRVYERIHPVGIHLYVESVYSCEHLEEQCLALHHRFGRQRAYVTQSEHRGAVGYDGYEIAFSRVGVCRMGIVGYG